MTFIQPNKNKSILNRVIAALSILIVLSVFGMVALYNNTVNLNHAIAATKAELNTVGAENTGMSNQVVAALGDADLQKIVAAGGLVQDQNPQYFPVHQPWPIASHF